jgi:hypothetical protein
MSEVTQPPLKKPRVEGVATTPPQPQPRNPQELAFLMGTKSPDSSIRRAFGSPMVHPLSERHVMRRIFGFLQPWPLELRTFRPPKRWAESEDGEDLPQVLEDGRVLVMFKKDFVDDWEYEFDSDDQLQAYATKEVYYDPETQLYEITDGDYRYSHENGHFEGDSITRQYLTLAKVIEKLKKCK